MKLFSRYACDGCPEHFDRECDDDVHMIHAHNGGNRIPSLLSALRVDALHFCSDGCRTRAMSGPPCERTVLTPSMKQQLRGIEHPDETDPPREPMGAVDRCFMLGVSLAGGQYVRCLLERGHHGAHEFHPEPGE